MKKPEPILICRMDQKTCLFGTFGGPALVYHLSCTRGDRWVNNPLYSSTNQNLGHLWIQLYPQCNSRTACWSPASNGCFSSCSSEVAGRATRSELRWGRPVHIKTPHPFPNWLQVHFKLLMLQLYTRHSEYKMGWTMTFFQARTLFASLLKTRSLVMEGPETLRAYNMCIFQAYKSYIKVAYH